jgi:hypothetical protein
MTRVSTMAARVIGHDSGGRRLLWPHRCVNSVWPHVYDK